MPASQERTKSATAHSLPVAAQMYCEGSLATVTAISTAFWPHTCSNLGPQAGFASAYLKVSTNLQSVCGCTVSASGHIRLGLAGST